jgi:hypothetical protein
MPISIDNGLPHITFSLGQTHAGAELCGLMDTCGALNTGYLPFHQWIMSTNPEVVAEYLEFDDANPFEPVKLGGAIRDPAGLALEHHGDLTAVIRYYTPYATSDGDPITISFALGVDVTVNTIFGLPMLQDLGSVIALDSAVLHSRCLDLDFPIVRREATCGFPPGVDFDPASHKNAALCQRPSSSHVTWDDLPRASTAAVDDVSLGYLRRTVQPTL